jgi:hypothetical protein
VIERVAAAADRTAKRFRMLHRRAVARAKKARPHDATRLLIDAYAIGREAEGWEVFAQELRRKR